MPEGEEVNYLCYIAILMVILTIGCTSYPGEDRLERDCALMPPVTVNVTCDLAGTNDTQIYIKTVAYQFGDPFCGPASCGYHVVPHFHGKLKDSIGVMREAVCMQTELAQDKTSWVNQEYTSEEDCAMQLSYGVDMLVPSSIAAQYAEAK